MDDLKLYAKSEQGLESLVHTVRIFSEDIGMDFGIEKCAKLLLRRGKVTSSDGIKLPGGKEIKPLDEGTGEKFLRPEATDRSLPLIE